VLTGFPFLADRQTKMVITGVLMLAVPFVNLRIRPSTELAHKKTPLCMRGFLIGKLLGLD
jgi:hypothetical protein